MNEGIDYMHSHSRLENELDFPKHIVLVDEKYKKLFADGIVPIEPFTYNGVKYYKVPIMAFVTRGGVFKNFKA